MSTNTSYRTYLRKILTTRLNETELRNLCFDLNVSYEDLHGSTKADKARELIDFLDRRHRLDELVYYGMQHRPDIDWGRPSIPQSGLSSRTRNTTPTDVVPHFQRNLTNSEASVRFRLQSQHIIDFRHDQGFLMQTITLRLDGQVIFRQEVFSVSEISHEFQVEGVDSAFNFVARAVYYEVTIQVGGQTILTA